MFTCKFPQCGLKLALEQAWVPELRAIRQTIGKPVTTEMLTDHTLCRR